MITWRTNDVGNVYLRCIYHNPNYKLLPIHNVCKRCQNIADWLIPLKKYTFEGNVVKCMALHEMLHTYHALCDSLKNQSESLCLRVLAFTPFQLQCDQIVLHSITSPTFSSTWQGFAMHALLWLIIWLYL